MGSVDALTTTYFDTLRCQTEHVDLESFITVKKESNDLFTNLIDVETSPIDIQPATEQDVTEQSPEIHQVDLSGIDNICQAFQCETECCPSPNDRLRFPFSDEMRKQLEMQMYMKRQVCTIGLNTIIESLNFFPV